MSQDQASMSSSRAIHEIEVYSSIRNFRIQHQDDINYQGDLNDHLMVQIHVLLEKLGQAKDSNWLTTRALGVARAKLSKAGLRERRDALHAQEFEAEIAFLRHDASLRHSLQDIVANRRRMMIGNDPDEIVAGYPDRVRIQAQFGEEQRRVEDLIADNYASWEANRQELLNQRLAISADIMRVPYYLPEAPPGTLAGGLFQDPFKSLPHPQAGVGQNSGVSQNGTDTGAAVNNHTAQVDESEPSGKDTKNKEVSSHAAGKIETSDGPGVTVREDSDASSITDDEHQDLSLLTAVDEAEIAAPTLNLEDDKENLPSASTPPPSPVKSRKRRYHEATGEAEEDTDPEQGEEEPELRVDKVIAAKQGQEATRRALGVLYDGKAKVASPRMQQSGPAVSAHSNSRKRRAVDEEKEEENATRQPTTEVNPIEAVAGSRASKRLRRVMFSEAEINEG